MKPYAELLEFNQPNPIRKEGFTRIRDSFPGLRAPITRSLPVKQWERDNIYDPERIMEFSGRWDYGSKNAAKLGEMATMRTFADEQHPENENVQVPIIQKYISMGHESMIEMGDATFFLECSRVVSHELVRHRLASFQQESQRFVKYDEEDPADLFYLPDGLEFPADDGMTEIYELTLLQYKELRRFGVAPQDARYVLPNAMRTRLIMKANAREWRHILKLRLDKSAQPEMQELMQQVYDQLVDIFPNAMMGVLNGERGIR